MSMLCNNQQIQVIISCFFWLKNSNALKSSKNSNICYVDDQNVAKQYTDFGSIQLGILEVLVHITVGKMVKQAF